jgi:hypothetical protein
MELLLCVAAGTGQAAPPCGTYLSADGLDPIPPLFLCSVGNGKGYCG